MLEVAPDEIPGPVADMVRQYAAPSHATLWSIPKQVLTVRMDENKTNGFKDGLMSGGLLKRIMGRVKRLQYPIRRGDLVRLESVPEYRNDGICIFDGRHMLDLGLEPDEYGTLPSSFLVITEFPVDYWHYYRHMITHNYIVWFHPYPFVDQLLSTVEYGQSLLLWGYDKFVISAHFTYRDQVHRIIYHSYLDVGPMDEQQLSLPESMVTPLLDLFRQHLLQWKTTTPETTTQSIPTDTQKVALPPVLFHCAETDYFDISPGQYGSILFLHPTKDACQSIRRLSKSKQYK